MKQEIVFVPLAMNQTLFYLKLAKSLKIQGVNTRFISCHERSCELIRREGFLAYDFHKLKRSLQKASIFSMDKFSDLVGELKIENPYLLMTHEREAYLIESFETLAQKFYYSLLTFKEIISELVKSCNPVVVQELGGFLSVVSSFIVAQSLDINNYFIEPSFFRGRVFFVKNSFEAPKIDLLLTASLNPECEGYINSTVMTKSIVVPEKDKLHYRGVFQKFFNFNNFKRLVQKIFDKYVLGLEEEFQYIGVHIQKYLGAILNRIQLFSSYKDIPNNKFVYFPLHVPADVALTIRAPLFFDQCYLIEQIAKTLDVGEVLCIKEHPAMVGAISSGVIKRLLVRNSNVTLLKPTLNNYDVMGRADRVYTINSKAGAESLLLGKEVILFGDAFYSNAPFIRRVTCLNDLFSGSSFQFKEEVDKIEVNTYFSKVWEQTFKGELYNLDERNCQDFANAIKNEVFH